MTHIITGLCLRDGACVEVCPVECIVPGIPEAEWPWYFIDPDTCIDCAACVPECPYEAIFPEEEVPTSHDLKEGQVYVAMSGERTTGPGSVFDLTEDIQPNYDYFSEGPGYSALG